MDDVVIQFKYVFRHHIDLGRITAICKGDKMIARSVAVRALRELADEIESNGTPMVDWDPYLKKTMLKNS